MIVRSTIAGVRDGARDAETAQSSTVHLSPYDRRRFRRARLRRAVARVDRFLFEDRPARERFLWLTLIAIAAALVAMAPYACRYILTAPLAGAHLGS